MPPKKTDFASFSFSSLEDNTGLFLRIAEAKTNNLFFNFFKSSEVKISDYTILILIDANKAIRQGALAKTLEIKRSNMTKIIDSLHKRHLITRTVPPTNRRSIELKLTDEGEALISNHKAKVDEAEQNAFSMLTKTEYDQLRVILKKISNIDH